MCDFLIEDSLELNTESVKALKALLHTLVFGMINVACSPKRVLEGGPCNRPTTSGRKKQHQGDGGMSNFVDNLLSNSSAVCCASNSFNHKFS